MEFGKTPELGYILNQLRSHRFHHTIINGFFKTITVSPFCPLRNSSKAQPLPRGFGFFIPLPEVIHLGSQAGAHLPHRGVEN